MTKPENKSQQVRNPTGRGGFRKGLSGNPGGRKTLPTDFKQAVAECSVDCVKRLQYWVNSTNPAASVQASKILLSYAHGNPPDFVTVTSPAQVINVRFANDDQPPATTPGTTANPI